ncbi:molybdopterin-dependent oxidoreductase [Fulvivirga maritima]|uniref:molybdopterin-dependent oxidoreductase n=1 Tax=Fulvivirga maritima TaxID=2904247 RepID=UPI001F481972|nr:molybdopterin-dependent oxidoreductase [Fulvivirga maritima]UII26339.1 molybdopterin-dependent oxidoreductase [Fulvivirga maritima]
MKAAWLCIIIAAFSYSCQSQPSPTFTLTNGDNTIEVSLEDLESLPQVDKQLTGHDKKAHAYHGVLLKDVLELIDVNFEKSNIKGNLTKYILVDALDGYKVIYSVTEVDPQFKDEAVFIAYQADNKSLPEHVGPFQMIVPGEKKHARWIREIKSINVKDIPLANN